MQVNFCKNPTCSNYGTPPKAVIKRGATKAAGTQDIFKIQAAGVGIPLLSCLICGEYPQNRLAGYWRALIESKGSADALETEGMREHRKNRSEDLERRIDAAVYELYGMSEAEIETVDQFLTP